MSVFQGPDGRWRFQVWHRMPDGSIARPCGSAPEKQNTKAAAEAAERKALADLINPPADAAVARKEGPFFKDFVKLFMETHATNNNQPSEIASKESNFRLHLIPFFGEMRMASISILDVEKYKGLKKKAHAEDMKAKADAEDDGSTKWVTKRRSRSKKAKAEAASKPTLKEQKPLAPKSINNPLIPLSKVLHWARVVLIAEGIVVNVPPIQMLKVMKPDIIFLEYEELERLVDAAANHSVAYVAAVLIAAEAGLRIGEIKGLLWEHLDLERGKLKVKRKLWRDQAGPPKSGNKRNIGLTARLLEALKVLKAESRPNATQVFATANNTPWKDGNSQRVLTRLCAQAGIKRVTWHKLRHTFCTHLADGGLDDAALMQVAGHAHYGTTKIYVHEMRGGEDRATAILNNRKLPAALQDRVGRTETLLKDSDHTPN